jgi:hypothetical protein
MRISCAIIPIVLLKGALLAMLMPMYSTSAINEDSCATILKEGNELFAIEACALARTIIDGNVLLLTDSKAFVLDVVCEPPEGKGPLCIPALSSIADRAAAQAGGCTKSAAGQPSTAIKQYGSHQEDIKVITNFLCTSTSECNFVVQNLTSADCWTSGDDGNSKPILRETCLQNVTCECMGAYVKATSILSKTGRNTLGANKDTIQLVRERANTLKPECKLPSGKKGKSIKKGKSDKLRK